MRRAFFVFWAFRGGGSVPQSEGRGVLVLSPDALRASGPLRWQELHQEEPGAWEAHVAAKKVAALAAADDALWASLRSPGAKDLGLTTQQNRQAAEVLLTSLGLAAGDAHRPGPDLHFGEALDGQFASRYGQKYLDVRHDKYNSKEDVLALVNPVEREAVRLVPEDPKKRRHLLSDALALYLKNHDNGGQEKFARDTRRAIDHVIAAVGDLPLELCRREHANAVRDHLLAKGGKSALIQVGEGVVINADADPNR